MPFSVYRIPGLTYGQYRQDVVFLECPEDAEINGKIVFDGLKEKHQREMFNKFDLWGQGQQHVNRYFHGFNQIGYRACFVFKRKEAGTYHRFYGFLIKPRPTTDASYRLCVLVSHAQKNQENTDLSELDLVNAMSARPEVIAAIKKAFPEKIGGANATLHRKR
jgi:hypothetical protein